MLNYKNQKKTSNFFRTILYCINFAWSCSKFYTICRLLVNIIIPINAIISSYILKYIIDILTKDSDIYEIKKKVVVYLILIVTTNIIVTLLNKLSEYSIKMQNDIIKKKIELKIMNISTESDLLMFDNHEYYDKFAIVQRDSQSILNILWATITLIGGAFSVVSSFIILSSANIYYGIIIVISVIPSIIINRYFTKKVYELSISQIKGERKESYFVYLATNKEYAQNIRLFNMGDLLKTRYKEIWQSMFLVRKKLFKKRLIAIAMLQILPEIAILFINMNIAFKVADGILILGDFVLYNGLVTQLWNSLTQAISSGLDVYDNKMKIDIIESISDFPKNISNSEGENINKIEQIEFKDVYFKYPGTNKYILKGINFTITENEKIVLVGTNGSGKSTLIKLLLRFYDPTKGVILVNGKDMRKFDVKQMRNCFGTYFQNSVNFGFSIKRNIAIKDSEEINDEDIIRVISEFDGKNILEKASHGVDTYLTRMFDEDGIEISGGEHQKIALARTFFENNMTIILDEPSSALDPRSEENIFRAMERLCKNKMVLFTSHRLTNVFLADKILVLEDGVIIENGTKNQLLKDKRRFAELYKYQADKFKN